MPCRCDYPEFFWNKEYKKVYEVYQDLKKVFPSIKDWSWRPFDESVEASKQELDEKTESLCKFINSRTKVKLLQCTSLVQNWIGKHNEMDSARKEEEKVIAKHKKELEKQKADNIARMTPAERKLFGY